jgi:hypothetical protein
VNRNRVYQLIDGERAYQDALPANRTDGEPRTVGDYLTMLQHYLNEAQRQWVMNAGSQEALDVIRKLAGISVHCMEDHGAPARQTPVVADVPDGLPASFVTKTTPKRRLLPHEVRRQPAPRFAKKLPAVDPPFRKKAKAKKR